jgi:anaerobic selenocysteine-containing dehydrogenase
MTREHFRTCTLCEAMCGIRLEVDGPRVLSIRGDEEDPFSRGHICPKAMGLKDLHDDPDRLRTPLRRVGERFEPIGWNEAFDLAAERLRAIRTEHGPKALALYQGNPTVHNLGSMLWGPLFARALGARARFSATSVDQLPHMLAAYSMFGHQLAIPVPDVDRTDLMILLGANPAVSNGSLMTAPGIADRLRAIRARGGQVIVLDPRRSETAELASAHHFVRPGSDVFLLLGMLHTLCRERMTTLAHLAPYARNFEALRSLSLPYTPAAVAEVVGVPARVIEELALALARTERAVIYGRMGVSTQEFGTLSCWLINVLNAITGHLDSVGGAMFTSPAIDPFYLGNYSAGHFDRYRSRVRNLPEFGGELPVATLAEEIDTPGPGQIRALVTSCGNPVLSTPNGARLERALPTLSFMVSIDMYLNETSRHAHLILPPAGPLERDHYDLAFHLLAVRNTAKYSAPVFPRSPDARHDWEIMGELSARLAPSALGRAAGRVQARVLSALGPRGIVDILLRTGPYGVLRRGARGLSVATLLAEPHGVDLGPLVPVLGARLHKLGQKLELAPQPFLADLPRVAHAFRERRAAGALVLIGRRQLRSNNSWLHNSARLIKGPPRCTLQMNPRDAKQRSLQKGALVEVRSRVGSVRVPLEITDALMEGVVSLPHGFGHARRAGGPKTAQRVAEAHAGESINDLTDERRVDELSGNASFSGLPVEVHATTPSEQPRAT